MDALATFVNWVGEVWRTGGVPVDTVAASAVASESILSGLGARVSAVAGAIFERATAFSWSAVAGAVGVWGAWCLVRRYLVEEVGSSSNKNQVTVHIHLNGVHSVLSTAYRKDASTTTMEQLIPST